MSTVPGLDVAFSAYTKAEAQALYDQGYRVCFVCLQTGGYANNDALQWGSPINLQVFREAGFYVGGYLNANPGTQGWITTQQCFDFAKRNAGAEWPNVKELVIDFEIEETPWGRVFELASLAQQEKPCRIVYTGKWVVSSRPPPSTVQGLRLWTTGAEGSPQYAPWTDAPIGWQTGQTTLSNGKEYDEDVFDSDFFFPPQPEEESMKTYSNQGSVYVFDGRTLTHLTPDGYNLLFEAGDLDPAKILPVTDDWIARAQKVSDSYATQDAPAGAPSLSGATFTGKID